MSLLDVTLNLKIVLEIGKLCYSVQTFENIVAKDEIPHISYLDINTSTKKGKYLFVTPLIYLIVYLGLTLFSTFFQFYHGNSSLIQILNPWVNTP